MPDAPGHGLHDWNLSEVVSGGPITFDDETLRDGLQSPSARRPSREERLRFLHLLAEIGVQAADVGLPGAGREATAECQELCLEIVAGRLPISPNCAARTREEDIRPIIEISQRIGAPVEVAMFLGASPLRRRIEGWSVADLVERTERTVRFAVDHECPVTFVVEDSSRSDSEDLRQLWSAAIRSGASRLCLADTAGHATPWGTSRLVAFAREVVAECGPATVGLDWHGHDDRGLAVANALAAAAAGAGRLHGTALGIGERVGNPPMEQLLVNAVLLGWANINLAPLMDYARHAAAMLGVGIPFSAPMVGRDAFRTSTGVHASALVKAGRTGDRSLVDLVYSAVPASWLGREQEIAVGPMSGASNVRAWLDRHGYHPTHELVARILAAAKSGDRTLSDLELVELAENRQSP